MSLNIFRQVIWWPRYLKKPIYSIIALIYGLSLSITDLIRLFWERNRPLDLRDLMGKLCVDFISSLLFLSLYLFSLKIGFICVCIIWSALKERRALLVVGVTLYHTVGSSCSKQALSLSRLPYCILWRGIVKTHGLVFVSGYTGLTPQ